MKTVFRKIIMVCGGVDLKRQKQLCCLSGIKVESMRIDLWTEMPVDEMKIFFHQTLLLMSDTHRATGDEKRQNFERFWRISFASELKAVESDNAAVVFSLNCRLNLGLFFYLI
jgi:hypothetical protein